MSDHFVQPGDRIVFPPATSTTTPPDVYKFLSDRGWWAIHSSHTWQSSVADLPVPWAEAVAIEFVRFITLGGPR